MSQSEAPDLIYILVIDDNPEMRSLLGRILTPQGHVVISVDSAEEGLAQLPWNTFQIAFLDQNLPGMEGLVLGEYLRQNNPHMAIALVTGSADPRLERVSQEQNITFIPKPFGVEQILDVVTAYQEAAQARLEARRQREDPDFVPSLAAHMDAVEARYAIPSVPSRIEERLVIQIRESLRNLGSVSRYNERDRAIALSGLVTARVLGIKLPRASSGQTLYEVYDGCMRQHGRRLEFSDEP
jgi:CheY-like chemotaxis protein